MPAPAHQHDAPPPPWAAVRTLVGAVLIITLLRIAYLAWFCPYSLVEDEAQYWVWSRHLAWSYYTKGPGVAWTIFASTSILGDAPWAVRLPAVLSMCVATLAVLRLGLDVLRDAPAARAGTWCFLLAPAFLVMPLMMTIDGPYVACWAIGALAAHRALVQRRPRWLLVLGLAIGVGVLYKYTMLLMLLGFVIYGAWHALVARRGTKPGAPALPTATRARAPWVLWGALGTVLMLCSFLPIILWNREHGWPTIAHLLGHLGLQGGDVQVTQGAKSSAGWHYNPLWTLTLLGSQLGMVGAPLVLAVIGVWNIRKRSAQQPDQYAQLWASTRLLLSIALAMYGFYLVVSLIAEPEGNWPIAGAVTLMPIAGWQVIDGMKFFRERVRTWRALPQPRPWRGWFIPMPWTATSALWTATIVMGVALMLCAVRLDVVAKVPRLGRLIPIGRITGGPALGAHAARLVDDLRARTGKEPFVITSHYGRASMLTYYMPSHPNVYCASSIMPDGRVTPWDFWPELRFRGNDALLGRPALAVGSSSDIWRTAFAHVGEPIQMEGDFKPSKDGTIPRPAFLCEDFHGFPDGNLIDAARIFMRGAMPEPAAPGGTP